MTVYVQIAKKMEEGGNGIDVSPIYCFISFLYWCFFDSTISKCIIMNYNSSYNYITIKEEEENAGLSQLT